MKNKTLGEFLERHTTAHPDKVWLRERSGENIVEWTWQDSLQQINAAGAWLEDKYGSAVNMALLSTNRPHWFFSDLAIIKSGNVTVPLFTTLSREHAEYILGFGEVRVLFLGHTANWDDVSEVLPDGVDIITLPGVDCAEPAHDLGNDRRGRCWPQARARGGLRRHDVDRVYLRYDRRTQGRDPDASLVCRAR